MCDVAGLEHNKVDIFLSWLRAIFSLLPILLKFRLCVITVFDCFVKVQWIRFRFSSLDFGSFLAAIKLGSLAAIVETKHFVDFHFPVFHAMNLEHFLIFWFQLHYWQQLIIFMLNFDFSVLLLCLLCLSSKSWARDVNCYLIGWSDHNKRF